MKGKKLSSKIYCTLHGVACILSITDCRKCNGIYCQQIFTKLYRLITAPSNDSPYQSSHLQQYNLNFDYGLNLSL